MPVNSLKVKIILNILQVLFYIENNNLNNITKCFEFQYLQVSTLYFLTNITNRLRTNRYYNN